MDQIEDDKSPDSPPADTQSRPSHTQSESAVKKILYAVLGFVLPTGIMGTGITSWFQHEEASYQNDVSQRKFDTQNLLDIQKTLNEMIEPRYIRAKLLYEALDDNAPKHELAAAKTGFYEIEGKWLDQQPNLSSSLEFYVDAPSHKEVANKRDEITRVDKDCDVFAFPESSTINASMASDVLLVNANCHDVVASKFKQLLDAKPHGRPASLGRDSADDATAKEQIRVALDHIWWINGVLRCVVMQRAIDIRYQEERQSLWDHSQSFFRRSTGGDGEALKEERGKRDCAADYRAYARKYDSKDHSKTATNP